MARPVHADADATRKRILTCASELFSEKGEGSTSIRDIAKEAKISLATVHHYFGSKADLYQACLDAMYDELAGLREALFAELPASDDVLEVIEKSARVTFRFSLAHKGAVRLGLRRAVDTGEIDEKYRETFLLSVLDVVEGPIAARSGRSKAQSRLALVSFNHMVVRFALTAPRELVMVMGEGDDPDDPNAQRRALGAVEAYLVDAARRLVSPAPTQ